MHITPARIELLPLLSLLLSVAVQSTPIGGFTAHYLASSQGVPCGQGFQSLSHDREGVTLESQGDFCLLGEAHNLTRLRWQEDRWYTQGFTTEVAGWFPALYRGEADNQGLIRVFQQGEAVHYPDGMEPAIQGAATLLQNLPLLAQSGQDVVTSYTWGAETRHYRFENLGKATLSLMGAPYTALHLRQSHPEKSRVADFWFAPDLGNQLVRLEVRRLGFLVLEVEMQHYQPASDAGVP
ncbi:hypothetical protein FCL40_12780 [Ferrimonas sediminicola]|uniref:DUF3108 domain-containing protein n=1 Tax=Ferrimonas sediminicola TaxID=2569538 RepID=A0A4U1BBD5_9GAMM|nr:hypothetical protein [Ferrimonas sediminicola]TKB48220.1 hypothetical protein FCL40_12780 [Ferrimonas sediminicola]